MADIMITGVYGQLGHALERIARRRGLDVVGHDQDTVDILDSSAVDATVRHVEPTTVVNCAALTAVDTCESDPDTANRVNGYAVGYLAAACNASSARLVQISTDYVFSGAGDRPYIESDPPAPISAYGRSKLLGEELAATANEHLVIRTAWLYGHGGRNFVETIRKQLEVGDEPLRVVADQKGSPTFCDDLAEAILDLDRHRTSGIVHVVNAGTITWHGFAVEIARLLGVDVEVVPVTTAEYPRLAPRPANSVLDTSRLAALIGRSMPPWQDALARYLEAPCGC
jgi:dTDP-4-dehydrorhamnose reductase